LLLLCSNISERTPSPSNVCDRTVRAFVTLSLAIVWQTHCGANEALHGFSDGGTENSVMVREIPTSNMAIIQHMNYFSAYSTGWADLDQVCVYWI
jgi:hypothetical protein